MYKNADFEIIDKNDEEYIMISAVMSYQDSERSSGILRYTLTALKEDKLFEHGISSYEAAGRR